MDPIDEASAHEQVVSLGCIWVEGNATLLRGYGKKLLELEEGTIAG
jgi:hypothetical protein